MSIRDLQLLADGFAIGAYTMLLIHIIQGMVDDRRAARLRLHRERIAAADAFRRSLRLYQLQQRIEAR